eukprot:CAMPEP_0172474290 /NCGR_PEP_ID=MMETSP1065-20121228/69282_1 /TAXON_ID=265537 /ORGANISM="Amphiprora paludosa, Strain CCMP125" /LENGTH=855 /DNA_ID=CAMNT_0013232469 /DNA_START=146 /DNA_END=2715 /DNA_ORIENTATION=+
MPATDDMNEQPRNNDTTMPPSAQAADAAGNNAAAAQEEEDDPKPKNALSSYNLFFQIERKRILDGTDVLKLPITPTDVVNILFEHQNKKKRLHRKSHGKISFRGLARTRLFTNKRRGKQRQHHTRDPSPFCPKGNTMPATDDMNEQPRNNDTTMPPSAQAADAAGNNAAAAQEEEDDPVSLKKAEGAAMMDYLEAISWCLLVRSSFTSFGRESLTKTIMFPAAKRVAPQQALSLNGDAKWKRGFCLPACVTITMMFGFNNDPLNAFILPVLSSTIAPPPPCLQKPKNALSSYNLFFQIERKRILDGTDVLKLPITPTDVVNILFEHQNKKKRLHRKSHGKISFRGLARTVKLLVAMFSFPRVVMDLPPPPLGHLLFQIADRWKVVDEDAKQVLEDAAAKEKTKYSKLFKEWKARQKERQAAKGIAGKDDEKKKSGKKSSSSKKNKASKRKSPPTTSQVAATGTTMGVHTGGQNHSMPGTAGTFQQGYGGGPAPSSFASAQGGNEGIRERIQQVLNAASGGLPNSKLETLQHMLSRINTEIHQMSGSAESGAPPQQQQQDNVALMINQMSQQQQQYQQQAPPLKKQKAAAPEHHPVPNVAPLPMKYHQQQFLASAGGSSGAGLQQQQALNGYAVAAPSNQAQQHPDLLSEITKASLLSSLAQNQNQQPQSFNQQGFMGQSGGGFGQPPAAAPTTQQPHHQNQQQGNIDLTMIAAAMAQQQHQQGLLQASLNQFLPQSTFAAQHQQQLSVNTGAAMAASASQQKAMMNNHNMMMNHPQQAQQYHATLSSLTQQHQQQQDHFKSNMMAAAPSHHPQQGSASSSLFDDHQHHPSGGATTAAGGGADAMMDPQDLEVLML